MDPITAHNIARTEQRIAVLRHLIETLEPKGKDVSEHRRMLEAAERLSRLGLRATSA
jgi:hypothetical protein